MCLEGLLGTVPTPVEGLAVAGRVRYGSTAARRERRWISADVQETRGFRKKTINLAETLSVFETLQ